MDGISSYLCRMPVVFDQKDNVHNYVRKINANYYRVSGDQLTACKIILLRVQYRLIVTRNTGVIKFHASNEYRGKYHCKNDQKYHYIRYKNSDIYRDLYIDQ